MNNHFVLPSESYRRDLNMYKYYIEDAARYMHIQTGEPIEKCRAFVQDVTDPFTGERPFVDPEVFCLTKETDGNRTKKIVTMSQYLSVVENNKMIMSPTMAVYHNPGVKESISALYIDGNVKKRGVIKKEQFAAKQAGDFVTEAIKEGEQTSVKIKNNSMSGAHASAFTILWNKSAHSSLTSTCRSASGNANASNERFIAGNRHYYHPDIAIHNIISIINNSDYVAIQKVMDKYGLVYPTVDAVYGNIKRSTDFYWRCPESSAEIYNLISKLSPLELAAYAYTADIWSLNFFNTDFVRQFITDFVNIPTEPDAEPDFWIGQMDDDLKAYVCSMSAQYLRGYKDLKDVKEKNPRNYGIIGAITRNIIETLDKYQDLIGAFWVTTNMPSSMAMFSTSTRRIGLVSDTDSTIFTVQDWTIWYRNGKLDFTRESNAVRATMVYLAAMLTTHVLATMSGNMGVPDKFKFKLAMKNEFAFPLFALTGRAKHYWAAMSEREGNVYEEFDLEIKGVELRSSNTPKHIFEMAKEMIRVNINKIVAGEMLNGGKIMREVADIERSIIASINKGEPAYLKRAQVKSPASYKQGDQAPGYQHYLMWQEVFAPKYGEAPPPAYRAVSVPIDGGNPTKMKEWFDKIADKELAERLQRYFDRKNSRACNVMWLPLPNILDRGIPEEILQGMDIRGLVKGVMSPFYIILESYGLFMMNDNVTRLASDTH